MVGTRGSGGQNPRLAWSEPAGQRSGEGADEVGELGEVAALDHGDDRAVRTGGGVAGVPVARVLRVQPPRVPGATGHLLRRLDREVAVVGARVAEHEE